MPPSMKRPAECADAVYMLALSIRQPFAELILRGIKRIESRNWPTKLIDQRFHIYAARKWAGVLGHYTRFGLSSGPSSGHS